uniref:Uncharacterized protein n=1 Tax=mine drainage metagenome TaxID=410659 RepID=E6QEM5_9ZZZZ
MGTEDGVLRRHAIGQGDAGQSKGAHEDDGVQRFGHGNSSIGGSLKVLGQIGVFTRSSAPRDPPLLHHPPLIQAHILVAKLVDLLGAVGNEDEGHALSAEFSDLRVAFFLEGLVAHGEDLVGQEDVGLQVDGHGEAQTHLHARGIILEWSVDEVLEFGELNDVLDALLGVAVAETVEAGVEEDVFIAAELGMEADAKLDEGGDAATGDDSALAGFQDAGDDLQQGALAGAIVPQQAQGLPLLHAQVDVIQGQEVLAAFAFTLVKEGEEAGLEAHGAVMAEDEFLADMLDEDGGGHQRSSTRCRALRRKRIVPTVSVATVQALAIRT